MNFLPFKIFLYQLYIYQLEEYDSKRFVTALSKKGLFPNKNLRKKAKLTKKALLLCALTLLQQFIISTLLIILLRNLLNNTIVLLLTYLIVLYIFIIFSFVFFIQSKDILWPIDYFAKRKMVKNAKAKLSTLPNLKIIGVTGSYGKTTMKETLYEFLKEQYNVVKTEGNNNTPLGISRTILNKVNKDTDIFIVEMGEYVKGDVKALCQIATPDIAVITGINEAHLERYLTMENAISTKFEIVEYAKKDALVLLNADDNLTIENYKKYVENKTVKFFSAKNNNLCNYKISEYEFNQEGKGQEFSLSLDNKLIGKITTQVLGEYIIGNIIAGFILGKEMSISDSKLRFAASQLTPVEHRLQPIFNSESNILVIDDTYNGNSDGIKEGIKLLDKFKNRRKVYVTPGLVETGDLTESIHIQIGKDLALVADLVILVKNSVTGYIRQGLLDTGFKEKNIVWYDNSKTIWEDLNSNLKDGDVVMLQNDWSDNYN